MCLVNKFIAELGCRLHRSEVACQLIAYPEPPAGEVVEYVLAKEWVVGEAIAGRIGRPDAAERSDDVVAGRLVDEHVARGADGQEQRHVHNLLHPGLAVKVAEERKMSCDCLLQRSANKYANFAKQDAGRARENR